MVAIEASESAAILAFSVVLIIISMILAGIADWYKREVPTVFWIPGVIGVAISFLAFGMPRSLPAVVALTYIAYGTVIGAVVGVVYHLLTHGALGVADIIAFALAMPFLVMSWISFIVGAAVVWALVYYDAGPTLRHDVIIEPNSSIARRDIPTKIVLPDGKTMVLPKNLKLAWQAAKAAPPGSDVYGRYAVPIVTILMGGVIATFIVLLAVAALIM